LCRLQRDLRLMGFARGFLSGFSSLAGLLAGISLALLGCSHALCGSFQLRCRDSGLLLGNLPAGLCFFQGSAQTLDLSLQAWQCFKAQLSAGQSLARSFGSFALAICFHVSRLNFFQGLLPRASQILAQLSDRAGLLLTLGAHVFQCRGYIRQLLSQLGVFLLA
jgi:hypothetical protein